LKKNERKKILFTDEEIQRRNRELGDIISNDYMGKDLVIISLLRGSFIFTSDLVRNIKIPVEIDFMTTSSYGNEKESTGNVEIISRIRSDIKERDVLVVDDIMDTGLTMKYVIDYLKGHSPNSIKTCVFLNKPSRRKIDLKPDYIGFDIPDIFIVGYGLNYGNYYRNMPYIFTFEEDN
jgi:hypoxanthine phosphoribosyltransferase